MSGTGLSGLLGHLGMRNMFAQSGSYANEIDSASNLQQYTPLYNSALAQQSSMAQQSAGQFNAALAQRQQYRQYNINRHTHEWVWNSKPVTITEFAELAYGDTPQKTMFLLKHSDKKEEIK